MVSFYGNTCPREESSVAGFLRQLEKFPNRSRINSCDGRWSESGPPIGISYTMQTTTGDLKMTIVKKRICGASVLAVLLSASAFAATNFVRTDLVADTAGAAVVTDPNLVGTWGMSTSAT